MTELCALAPGKLNLCLFLGAGRLDGRHELVSVVESVSLADSVELDPAPPGAVDDEVVCPGVEGPNLAAEALRGFRRATGWDGAPVRVRIDKRVPVAAGMGGGSGDAAAVLRLLARVAGRRLDEPAVIELARALGADVPAQVQPGLLLAEGAGERVTPLEPLEEHGVLVLALEHRLATASVFAEADRLGLPRAAEDLEARGAEVRTAFIPGGPLPLALLRNDLEPAARSLCPAVEPALADARAAGAAHAMVSGSGPTVVGLFPGPGGADAAHAAAEQLAGREPRACAARPVQAAFAAPAVREPAR